MSTHGISNASFNASALANLRSLLAIRSIALLGQTGVLAYVVTVSQSADNLTGLITSLLLMAVLTLGGWWRAHQDWPVTDGELLGQLLLDIIVWSALMYFSGGATNPFISYYIVPIVVAAAVLPIQFTWVVTAAALLAYSLLLYQYEHLHLFSPSGGHTGDDARAHMLGMWFNFLFSAALIIFFMVRMAASLRSNTRRDTRLREERLRNDQIVAVASLAAGTAHELGTPLSTMTITVDEMLADESLGEYTRADCELLSQQLKLCRETLRALSQTAETTTTSPPRICDAWTFLSRTVDRWAVRRPGMPYDIRCVQSGDAPAIVCDSTLQQALENLINNGADSGSERLRFSLSWDLVECCISIRDWGSGLPPHLDEEPGKAVVLGTAQGMGIGLMLSHASVERFGGRIELRPLDDGTEARLILPLLDEAPAANKAAAT